MDAVPKDTAGVERGRLSILRQRDVLFYLIGRFLWISATQVMTVAVSWLVYDVTHSAMALGLVGLAAFGPKLALSLVSGIVADRFERRLVIGCSFILMAVVALGLLSVAVSEPVAVGRVYGLFILFGIARGFATPASQAMVANLVPRDVFSRVVGISSSTSQIATIIGPALGGLLYVFGAWIPFAVASTAYLLAAALNFLIKKKPQTVAKSPVKLSDMFAGLAFIWHRPAVLGAISLDLFTVLLGGATALLPIIANEILHLGPMGLGVLRSAPAVGAVMVGLFLAYHPIERNAGVKLFIATTIFGLATIMFCFSANVYLSLAMLWLIGASDVCSVVIRQTLVQADTPDAMRGRVAAVNSVFVGASNELGEFESGATAALFGLVPAIVCGGVGTIIVSALWAWMFPALRRRDYLVET